MRHIRQNNSWNVLPGLFLPESGQIDQTTVFKVKYDGETATFYVHHVQKLKLAISLLGPCTIWRSELSSESNLKKNKFWSSNSPS